MQFQLLERHHCPLQCPLPYDVEEDDDDEDDDDDDDDDNDDDDDAPYFSIALL